MSKMRPSFRPRFVSFFAGGGGSSMGYHKAGYEELLATDYDAKIMAVFAKNFPQVPTLIADIKNLTAKDIMDETGLKPGELDLMDGSPPCQGFSSGGKWKLKDDKNYLFFAWAKILRGLQPKVFIGENVAGLVRGKMKMMYANIKRELVDCGYVVKAKVLNSANYEVPQKRRRVIIIGVREDLGLNPIFPTPTGKIVGMKKLDERPFTKSTHSRFKMNKWTLRIQKQGYPCDTVTVVGTHVWTDTRLEFGIKSYAYAQTFPEDYIWAKSYTTNKTILGNAVPVNMMYHIAKTVKDEILLKTV